MRCTRPDEIYRLGVVRPAGCAVIVQEQAQQVARDFAYKGGLVAPYANQQIVLAQQAPVGRVVMPSGPTAQSTRPGFLRRFFGGR